MAGGGSYFTLENHRVNIYIMNKLLVLGIRTIPYVPITVLPLKSLHLVTYTSLSPQMFVGRYLAIWQAAAGEKFIE